jgi:hypothetical protein
MRVASSQFSQTTRARSGLASESIKRLSLALESVDDFHGGHCLAARWFRVSDTVTNDILQKDLDHTTRFLVNETRDTLHTTAMGETTNWLWRRAALRTCVVSICGSSRVLRGQPKSRAHHVPVAAPSQQVLGSSSTSSRFESILYDCGAIVK